MPTKSYIKLTSSIIKEDARLLQLLSRTQSTKGIKLGHAFDLIGTFYEYKNWDCLSAELKKETSSLKYLPRNILDGEAFSPMVLTLFFKWKEKFTYDEVPDAMPLNIISSLRGFKLQSKIALASLMGETSSLDKSALAEAQSMMDAPHLNHFNDYISSAPIEIPSVVDINEKSFVEWWVYKNNDNEAYRKQFLKYFDREFPFGISSDGVEKEPTSGIGYIGNGIHEKFIKDGYIPYATLYAEHYEIEIEFKAQSLHGDALCVANSISTARVMMNESIQYTSSKEGVGTLDATVIRAKFFILRDEKRNATIVNSDDYLELSKKEFMRHMVKMDTMASLRHRHFDSIAYRIDTLPNEEENHKEIENISFERYAHTSMKTDPNVVFIPAPKYNNPIK